MGPLELPREGSAAVHTQQPAQRWVQRPPETSRAVTPAQTSPHAAAEGGGDRGSQWGTRLMDFKRCLLRVSVLEGRLFFFFFFFSFFFLSPFCEIEMFAQLEHSPAFGIVTVGTVARGKTNKLIHFTTSPGVAASLRSLWKQYNQIHRTRRVQLHVGTVWKCWYCDDTFFFPSHFLHWKHTLQFWGRHFNQKRICCLLESVISSHSVNNLS